MIYYMCNHCLSGDEMRKDKAKKHYWNICRSNGGGGCVLGLWDGNPVKLDCDEHYTTTDVIKKLIINK